MIPCWFCTFAHWQRKDLSIILMVGLFESERQNNNKKIQNGFQRIQKSYKLICILMSEISIWPLRKTWLRTWWQNPCWQSQRSDVSCSWPPGLHTSQERFLSKSLRFRGLRLATRTFSSLHRFSMGLRSGDWLGHSRTLMCFFLSHSLLPWPCVLGHCHAGIPIHDPFSMPWLASMPWPWRYMAPSIIPLMRCRCPVPLAEKHPKA